MAFGETAARDPQTKPAKLARLARSRNALIRQLVALNRATPVSSLRELSADSAADVVAAVANNVSTPGSELARLSRARDEGVRLAVASNPATPQSVLNELAIAADSSSRIKLAVAANSATPAGALNSLATARGHSDDVRLAIAANPSATAYTLSNIGSGKDFDSPKNRALGMALAKNRASPTSIRATLYSKEPFRESVLSTEPMEEPSQRILHARTGNPYSALNLLSHDADPEVRRAVAVSLRAPKDILNILAKDARPDVVVVARARLTDDPAELLELARSRDTLVLEALARNPQLPIDMRAKVARASLPTADVDTVEMVANDPSTPAGVLHDLATRSAEFAGHSFRVKRAVAQNESTSSNTVATLATDDDAQIRALAGKSRALPLGTLVKLAADTDPRVREAVASNASTPAEILLRMASDNAPAVAEAVAKHFAATAAVLEHVVNSQLNYRSQLRPQSSYSRDLPTFPLGPVVEAARNSKTPPEALGRISGMVESARSRIERSYSRDAQDKLATEEHVWLALASNPSTPSDVLDKIARIAHKEIWVVGDPDRVKTEREGIRGGILHHIVHNPSSAIAVLEFLSDGRWAARRTKTRSERSDAGSWNVTWTVWDEWATAAGIADTAREVRAEISLRTWKIGMGLTDRLGFADNADTSPSILAELAIDPNDSVRSKVAANPSTPTDAFLDLAQDPVDEVRLAAAGSTHPDDASARYRSRSSYDKQPSREKCYEPGFILLAKDSNPGVRVATIANLTVFWDVLSKQSRSLIAFDPDPLVRSALVSSIVEQDRSYGGAIQLSSKALAHLITNGSFEVWRALAGRLGGLTPKALEMLVDTGDPETVRLVAQHHNANRSVRARLAKSEDPSVLETIASQIHPWRRDQDNRDSAVIRALVRNPRTPEEFLEGMARYANDSDLLSSVIQNPNTPENVLVELAKGNDEPRLRAIAKSGSRLAKLALAENPAAPVDILASFASQADRDLRQALVVNKGIPPELLVGLIEAGHRGESAGRDDNR